MKGFIMKKLDLNRPNILILAGCIGLILCLVLLFAIEFVLEAPDASTLYYRQSRWTLGFFILIPLSIYALARGITWRIQEKRAGLRE
jgi:hypothetical protein